MLPLKKLLLSILTFSVFVTLLSCGKEAAEPSGVFTAVVDGRNFRAEDIQGIFWSAGDDVDVYAYSDDTNGFWISLAIADVEEGTSYDLADDEVFIVYYDKNDNAFFPQNGEISITKLTNTNFQATFEFDGKNFNTGNRVEVTSGVVKVTLKKEE